MGTIVGALFTNWKTTLAGALGAVGTFLATQTAGWVVVGQVLQALAVFLLGAVAKDSNVSGTGAPPAP